MRSSTIGLLLGIQSPKIKLRTIYWIKSSHQFPHRKNAKTYETKQGGCCQVNIYHMYECIWICINAFLQIHLHPHIFQRLKQVFQPPQPKKKLWSVPSFHPRYELYLAVAVDHPFLPSHQGKPRLGMDLPHRPVDRSTGRQKKQRRIPDKGVFIEHTTVNTQKKEYISLQPQVHSANKYMVINYVYLYPHLWIAWKTL